MQFFSKFEKSWHDVPAQKSWLFQRPTEVDHQTGIVEEKNQKRNVAAAELGKPVSDREELIASSIIFTQMCPLPPSQQSYQIIAI